MSMDTNYMVIDFSPAGTVAAMHRDEFNLGFLGNQQIERASEIKFDEAAQKWAVYLPLGVAVHDADAWFAGAEARGFADYNIARKFEVRWLEICRLQSVAPLSDTGRLIADKLRPEFGLDRCYSTQA